jgi:two-component system nitrate/nitrite response regulator NarL
MLTVSDSSFDVMEALKAGASGYLLKDMEPDEFCLKLRQVAAGHGAVGRGGLSPSPSPQPREHRRRLGLLTVREQETLELVSKGLPTRSWPAPRHRRKHGEGAREARAAEAQPA